MSFADSYSRQNIDQRDVDAVSQALTKDFLTQGPMVEKFEQQICETVRVKYSLAVNNATSGLLLALMALGINRTSLVWTSPNTFVSSANVAKHLGAKVDFVDIDPLTWMISPETLEAKLEECVNTSQPTPDVVVLVHFGGVCYDLSSFSRLARKFNFKIVEDAAHAFGASYSGDKKVGCCVHSDMCVFSFHAIKPVTTGEGGAVTTRCDSLYEKMKRLRSHGITRDPKQFERSADGPWYYEQQSLGFNFRITDFQCALGLSQILRSDEFIARKLEISNLYKSKLSPDLTSTQLIPMGSTTANHLFPVLVSRDKRRQLFTSLQQAGIGVNVHYIPVYKHPYYELTGSYGSCPNNDQYYEQTLSLPMHTYLSKSDALKICKKVNQFLKSNHG